MSEHLPEYVSTAVAARMLGISQEAVSRNVRQGRIRAIQVGRTWAIPRDALLEFAKTYQKGPGRRKPKAQEGRKA
ncbi:MAG: helix-turn-helix domain-containing protein [Chloroflexi bacterium]|nr:helix-turn-helix domain-containing protein [Chloroflexota bacterium]